MTPLSGGSRAAWLTCTFLGIGRSPWAPGTVASVAAILPFYFLIDHPWLHALVLALVIWAGVAAADRLERDSGEKDPGYVVIDEVAGMGLALLAVPKEWYFIVMAFLLFRVFDIWKPFPIRKVEKFPGGWGVMADDLLAGLLARLWVQVGLWTMHFLR